MSLADAPAVELGRTTIADPGNPPFAFSIDFDPADVRQEHTYSVRAQVSVGRKLIFVSDKMNPVLTHGAPDEVQIWMIKVGDTAQEAQAAPTQIGAHGLRLPASFAGDLPCRDCEALRYRLNLWPDQVFHLRRTWEGTDRRRDSVGRWSVDPDRRMLTLRGAEEELKFEIVGPDRIRLLPEGAGHGRGRGTLPADRRDGVPVVRAAPAAPGHADLRRRGGAVHRVPDRARLSAGAGRRLCGARACLPGGRGRARRADHGELRRRDPAAVRGGGRGGRAGGAGRAVRRGLARRDLRAGRGHGEPDQHLLEDPAARRDRAGGRRRPARAEPDPARTTSRASPRRSAATSWSAATAWPATRWPSARPRRR